MGSSFEFIFQQLQVRPVNNNLQTQIKQAMADRKPLVDQFVLLIPTRQKAELGPFWIRFLDLLCRVRFRDLVADQNTGTSQDHGSTRARAPLKRGRVEAFKGPTQRKKSNVSNNS